MGKAIMPKLGRLLLAAVLILAAGMASRGWVHAATPDAHSIKTETIEVAPGQDAAPEPTITVPATPAPGDAADTAEIPKVEYGTEGLPAPVARLREQIIEAAKTGDIEKLRMIVDANGTPPDFGQDEKADAIAALKAQSGDDGGREILAILLDILEAGYVHIDAGTPQEVYVWPYFVQYPIDKLSPAQLVELFRIVYAGDYEDMLDFGHYTFYRTGIAPDGTWKFFVTE
jgi:hypothetical protein